ncbi:MAG: hypothetical protein ABI216_21585 [Devosia sp.]
MADEKPDLTFAAALAANTLVHSLVAALKRKGVITPDEHHEIYDSALFDLEQISGLSPNDATMAYARQMLEAFEKAARTRSP